MRICKLLVFLVVMALATAVAAEESKSPSIVSVRVGIADRYKAGLWTQVEVTVLGGREKLIGEMSVVVPDGDGVPGRVSKKCEVLPGVRTVVSLISRFGRVEGELKAELRVDKKVVASRTFKTAREADAEHFLPAIEFQKLIVSMGSLGVEDAVKLGAVNSEYRPVTAHVDGIERLPTEWCGYEGVDAVVLSTSHPGMYKRLADDDERVKALDQWVRMGGRLVLCVGKAGAEILAEGTPLRRFAPGRFEKMTTLRQTGAIETYCGSRISASEAVGGKVRMAVPRLSEVQGVVEAAESNLPLIVRTARGFGQVIFVAADLDQSPLDRWSDRPLLVARLLDMPTTPVEESKENAAMMHFGYSDLSGQLRSALDNFAGVQLAPFWLVAGLIVVYILLIGPGDYFFLRKVVRRMEWTWVTFPLIVGLVCIGAYVLAYRLKGDRLRVNQIDLVDVDAVSGKMRGTSWLNVFSPRMESFDFSFDPCGPEGSAEVGAGVWTAWLGLPGSALGGMNPHANSPSIWSEEFRYASNLNGLLGVPIQVWSTKSLTARWESGSKAFPEAELIDTDQILSGSVSNTLPFPLQECLLAYGGSVYELGDIKPGESVRLGPTIKRSELKTLLTRQKAVFAEGAKSAQEATPYDQSSANLVYILRIMMFYDAAGGRHYTGLWNTYQSFVDLSPLLKAERAILVVQQPIKASEGHEGAELLRDGKPLAGSKDQHETIYRFVLPVKKAQ